MFGMNEAPRSKLATESIESQVADPSDRESIEVDSMASALPPEKSIIVGVGASAGGLDALERMFSVMPVDTGMAFVIVQHLSPDFKSHMDKLLSRVTSIPVKVVTDGEIIQANTIYLLPTKKEMVVSNGKLLLTERASEKVLTHPIDQFLRSLAQDSGSRSAAVILSGTGSDGSRGVVEIDQQGGLTIAQDPRTCSFDAMPTNACDTGRVRLVLAPEEIGAALKGFHEHGLPVTRSDQLHEATEIESEGLARVFQLLQRAHKIDFSLYKSGTVGRRVQRRIEHTNRKNLEEYVELLQEDSNELDELYKDLLIGVTKFFRDREAFQLVNQSIIPELIENSKNGVIRIWVCACATGEEAYSLAILLSEAIEQSGKSIEFKIFATDAHKRSLQFAATAIYPKSSLDQVSAELRDKYFVARDDGYMVTSDLRRTIVFAPHNVLTDPPFTQMNMVSCRNMLIYLQPPAQRKTLSLFHFALKLGGILFLGPSESPGDISDEFEPIDPHWKIYRKRRDIRLPVDLRMPLNSSGLILPQANRGMSREATRPDARDLMPPLYDELLRRFMPPSVVVDDRFEILHVFSGAESFLRIVAGRPSTNLLDQIHPSMKPTLAGALRHAQRDNTSVRYQGIEHPTSDVPCYVQMVVTPMTIQATKSSCLLVQFESEQKPSSGVGDVEIPVQDVSVSDMNQSRIESLERDLDYSRQNLQATIEELETSNEELQATNEEMVAANEELQSTNEELHSVNEELYTVNAEHQRRLTELDQANADMNNLLASTRVGVVFLDSDFYIRRYTPAVGRMFYMEPHDIGRSFGSFLERIGDKQFMTRLEEVKSKRAEREWDIKVDGDAYLVRALPYWTQSGILGVVVAFINVQPLAKATADLARFKYMCDASYDAQILTDSEGRIAYCNSSLAENLGYSTQDIEGMPAARFDREFELTKYQTHFEAAQKEGGQIFESRHIRKDGSSYPVEVSLTYVVLNGESYLYCQARDITSRLEAESHRRLLESAIDRVENGIVITDVTLPDNPISFVNPGFSRMTGYTFNEAKGRNCRFLQGADTSAESVQKIREAMREGKTAKARLLNYRKDGRRFWNELNISPVEDTRGRITHFVGVQNDVTEQIEFQTAVETSEQTIRALLDSTAEGIYGVDLLGNCTFCNPAAAELLGYASPEELIGENMHALIHHTKVDGSAYPIEECPIYSCLHDEGRTSQFSEVFWRKDGSSIPVQYWSHVIRINEKTLGAVVTFIDISDRLSVEKELREARDLANSASLAKSQFLANMSHELRTPLAAILGFTEILRQEFDNQDALEKLEAIGRNGHYLLRLLNDVLDLSRIEAGKMKIECCVIELTAALAEVDRLMQIRTREYKNELRFVFQGKLPRTIQTDGARLRQILINLIANALKFAPEGKVEVRVSMVDDKTIRFEVKDNGIGISEEQQQQLFQPFSQASDQIYHRYGGTGLGLSITQRLLDAMGGQIAVDSQLGVGSTFTFTLPVGQAGEYTDLHSDSLTFEQEVASESAEVSTEIKLDARILIADDMRDVRYIAEHVLKRAGCSITAAENGQQAVEFIEKAKAEGRPFELVLMDVQMPVMSGEEAVLEIRRRGFETPVIALTADAMKGTKERLLRLGFNNYLSKPVNFAQLTAIVAYELKSRDNKA